MINLESSKVAKGEYLVRVSENVEGAYNSIDACLLKGSEQWEALGMGDVVIATAKTKKALIIKLTRKLIDEAGKA